MIRKVLIANRGEIACRIAKTCRDMGIATVAIYSDADSDSLHVETADEAIYIGASPANESYLNGAKIIEVAQYIGADAIHPGYGFLAENAEFAQAVIDAGIIFIGPPPSAIEAMGKKRESKLMLEDVPLIAGYEGEDQSNQAFISASQDIGFPIMVKASAGGGGKGMRRVDSIDDLPDALETARREAKQAFGDDTLILEKFVTNPRHIEVQIFGDQHGHIIAMGERECSIQRRHQKIIEETPSTILTQELRRDMCQTAVKIGQQLGYYSAGTVEFLVDEDLNYYFMEMNTRLQVEHPVTEEVTGHNLLRLQILVAEGQPLLYMTDPSHSIGGSGHAIEVRVYAEDPNNDFLPVTGKILRWREPVDARLVDEGENQHFARGLRIDSSVRSGDEISVYYDPMLAKVIAWAHTREDAIRKLDYALSQLQMLGMRNNISFLRKVLTHPDHLAGNITTHFIEDHPELFESDNNLPPVALIGAGLAKHLESDSEQHWRNNPNRPIRHQFSYGDETYDVLLTPKAQPKHYEAQVNENKYSVRLLSYLDGDITLVIDGHRQTITAMHHDNHWWIHITGHAYQLQWITPLPLPGRTIVAEGSLRAPMPGQIISIRVEIGQAVNQGDILVIMEAMKMEHRIQAPHDGIVSNIYYQIGDSVQADAVLLEINKEQM